MTPCDDYINILQVRTVEKQSSPITPPLPQLIHTMNVQYVIPTNEIAETVTTPIVKRLVWAAQ